MRLERIANEDACFVMHAIRTERTDQNERPWYLTCHEGVRAVRKRVVELYTLMKMSS